MKTQLLLWLMCLLTFSTPLLGQSSDVQWLISNSKGKTGMTGSSNVYTYGVGSVFSLNGIALPNRSRSSNAKNDVFAIFNDFTHFNSRSIPYNDASFTFNLGTSASGIQVHNFSIPPATTLGYMYLTNIYEEDDYPQGVSVGALSLSGNSTPYPMTTTIPTDYLTASHDVVFTKDITIIINLAQVKKDRHLGDTFDLRLTYDGVEQYTHPSHVLTGQDILDPSSAFVNGGTSSYGFPIGSVSPGTGEEVIINDGQEQFRYVNFKPTDYAIRYAPVPEGSYKAVFTLKLNGTPIDDLREKISHSHDPNFLRVDSIAKADDGGYYVFYHLEFENDGDMPTNQLKAEVEFPEVFDPGDLQAYKWFAARELDPGNATVVGNKCTFEFINENALYKCDDSGSTRVSDTNQCKGYVEFKVKVMPGYDVTNVDNSLMLTNPQVYFDAVPFELNEFYDLVRLKRTFPLAAQLYRPLPSDGGICKPYLIWIFIISALIIVLLLFIYRRRLFS
jgi:hypothetical protein